MALILYGSNLSPFVRKVRVVLIEKGIDYTLEQINPFRPPPDFDKISPLRRIPVLRDSDWDTGMTLPDSSVIVDYLENRFPTPALFPADLFLRARAMWFEEYVDGAVFAEMGPKLFFERVVKKFLRGDTDESICARAVAETLPPFFDYLNGELGTKPWFAGDAFSIADITVGSVLANYRHSGEKLDPKRWPHLAAHAAKVHARPSFAALLAEEQPLIDLSRRR